MPRLSRASRAASCSASFFERPVPVPTTSPSMIAAAVNDLSCGGPSTLTVAYDTLRPLRASCSCSSVLWSTNVVSAYSIRGSNASTIAPSIASNPCSRYAPAIAASSSAASTFRFRDSRCASSLPPRPSRSPSPSSRETTAQLARETTCERTFAMRPSEKSGKRSKSARAIASSSTESPRNSSRSYEAVRSAAHDACVKTAAARSGGSSSTSSRSVFDLLVRGDVVDGLPDGRDLLGILVGDLDPELILELHDQLDEVERVGVEVVLERRLLGDLILLDSELLRQDFLDALEDFFTRSCHVTSIVFGGLKGLGSVKTARS